MQALADLLDPPAGVWREQPKQQVASDLAGRVDEILYGGAAGGGKTEWLIRYMIRQCESYPGNRCIIFRRVYPSLNRTVIPRAKVILHKRARWNSQDKTFTFPNSSVLEVGSMQYKDDYIDYQGAEYGCIGFEEITEFLEEQVGELTARLRSTVPGVRPHMVATTNPGGVGHAWVKRRWVKPKKEDLEVGETMPAPGEIWRPAPRDDLPKPPLRAFVAATLQDNPALLSADPGYVDRLNQNKNRARRKALSTGDWDAIDAVEGALWTATDLDGGRVRPEYVRGVGLQRRLISVDPSDGNDNKSEQSNDEYGVADVGLGYDAIGYVLGSYAWTASVAMMAKRTLALYYETQADGIVIERNHGGKWMLQVFRSLDPNANIIPVWASDGKKTRAEPVAALFEFNEGSVPYRARMAGYHEELEDELTGTEFGPGMVSPNRLDAMVWGFSELMVRPESRGGGGRRTVKDVRLRGRR